jgi:DNA-directed RNA polymerase specialized sigma24 family protein
MPGLMLILAFVIGDEFAAVLAAAQDGSEAAFAALWRDSNPVVPLAEVPGAQEPRAQDAAGLAMQNLSTAAAIAAVSALPPLQAEVILLRVLAGLDTEAVAQIVGRSPGAVRVAAHRGLRRLAQTLARTGVTL